LLAFETQHQRQQTVFGLQLAEMSRTKKSARPKAAAAPAAAGEGAAAGDSGKVKYMRAGRNGQVNAALLPALH